MIYALIGGMLIGVAVVGYLFSFGKVVGVSGMISQSLQSTHRRHNTAAWFLGGIVLSSILASLFGLISPQDITLSQNPFLLALAGILVGLGTRLGSGCTSGHGICGIARLSLRSMVATVTFILSGVMTVAVLNFILGVQ